jgi:hypothetical protein
VTGFFAFHPTDTQLAQADDKKKDFLVMFPSTHRQVLEIHVQTLMRDFAASLLMAFEN